MVILFSDIVGFTDLSSKLPTAEVFLMLSNMFNAFDKLTDRFSVYKVVGSSVREQATQVRACHC